MTKNSALERDSIQSLSYVVKACSIVFKQVCVCGGGQCIHVVPLTSLLITNLINLPIIFTTAFSNLNFLNERGTLRERKSRGGGATTSTPPPPRCYISEVEHFQHLAGLLFRVSTGVFVRFREGVRIPPPNSIVPPMQTRSNGGVKFFRKGFLVEIYFPAK